MGTKELIKKLSKLNITLRADGEKLKWTAPQGVVSAELLSEMQEHKPEILALLKAEEGGKVKAMEVPLQEAGTYGASEKGETRVKPGVAEEIPPASPPISSDDFMETKARQVPDDFPNPGNSEVDLKSRNKAVIHKIIREVVSPFALTEGRIAAISIDLASEDPVKSAKVQFLPKGKGRKAQTSAPKVKRADSCEEGASRKKTSTTISKEARTVPEPDLDLSAFENKIILGDCQTKLKELPDNSVDLIATDPPYGLKFMGKDWDKAVPRVEVWKECFRVLKPGTFAFIMCTPRQDCLSEMIVRLHAAGFNTNFTSLYWTYAQGFPKAHSMSKAIDKKLGLEREVLEEHLLTKRGFFDKVDSKGKRYHQSENQGYKIVEYKGKTKPACDLSERFEGSYAGFQPKPAVEVIIVIQKPITEVTFTGQALKNGKGITWLDDCRIPYSSQDEKWQHEGGIIWSPQRKWNQECVRSARDGGRFPANLLVSDDILDDGKKRNQGHWTKSRTVGFGDFGGGISAYFGVGEKDTPDGYSRFFSLDAWAERNLPFLIVPKASKREKDAGLEQIEQKVIQGRDPGQNERNVAFKLRPTPRRNQHPTVKPLKLMAYLITMGSREGDIVLDPFAGSGTTCVAAKMLNRRFIGIEINEDYCEISAKRLEIILMKKAA